MALALTRCIPALPLELANELIVAVTLQALAAGWKLLGTRYLTPRERAPIAPDASARLRHPLQQQQIDTAGLVLIGGLVPVLLLGAFSAAPLRDVARLGLALGIAEIVTIALKSLVGRPRPNALALLAAGGHQAKEARRSFPSGHSALSVAGLGYAATALAFAPRWPRLRSVCLLPATAAIWVGKTRVEDHWHFWTDVAAGQFIGAAAVVAAGVVAAAAGVVAAAAAAGVVAAAAGAPARHSAHPRAEYSPA